VADDASNQIVEVYAKGTIPEDVANEFGREKVQIMIFTEIEMLLNRSFFDQILSTFGSYGSFIEGLTSEKTKEVTVKKDSVDRTIAEQDCRIIPCDPKKCDPNTCAVKAIQQTFSGPQ
jgi:hypothetical protein